MPVPRLFEDRLALPVVCAPLFIVSTPELVAEQCKAGIVGTMPSINVREANEFENTIIRLRNELDVYRAANPSQAVPPFGINLIVHKTNLRLQHDLEICLRQKVPVIITSLGASGEIVKKVHDYGGIVFHDVINMRHARKAIAEGVDGIVAVCSGAGGHAGALSPIAFVRELRAEFDGTILLSGAISDGAGILAALAMGADMAYIGSRFIATKEAGARDEYKQMILDSSAADIVYTPLITGVHANYLRNSMINVGLDPDNLDTRDKETMTFASGSPRPKAWKDIWGCGQGIGNIKDIPSARELIARMGNQFADAQNELSQRLAAATVAVRHAAQ